MFKRLLVITFCFAGSQALATENKVLVVGDSLSAGFGVSNTQTWVSLLQRRLAENGYTHRVINASVSGDTTTQGLAKLPAALQRHRPELVIIELGGNDGLRALAVDLIRHNLRQMIQLALQQNAGVLLLGTRLPPNYGPVYVSSFEAVYRDLAAEFQIALVPFLMQGVATDAGLMQEDGIHPNAAGHKKMLDNLWPELEKLVQ